MLRNEPVRQARSPRFRCDGRDNRRHLVTASRRCCAVIETRLETVSLTIAELVQTARFCTKTASEARRPNHRSGAACRVMAQALQRFQTRAGAVGVFTVGVRSDDELVGLHRVDVELLSFQALTAHH